MNKYDQLVDKLAKHFWEKKWYPSAWWVETDERTREDYRQKAEDVLTIIWGSL